MLCLSVPQSLLAQSRAVNQLRLWALLATAEGRIETLNKSLVESGLSPRSVTAAAPSGSDDI